MCDPVSLGVGVVTAAASLGMGAKQAHDQRKAQREAEKIEAQKEARQKATLEAKGASAVHKTDTLAADEERRRRQAVMNNTNVLTSRMGILGTPNTANTALAAAPASRTTLG